MDIKQSTLGQIQVEETVPENVINNDVDGGQIQTTDPANEIVEGQGLDANAVEVKEPEQVAETVVEEENTSTFSLDLDEPVIPETKQGAVTATKPTNVSWQEAIKGVDRREVAKALGFNDFAIELDESMAKGVQPIDYLNARAIDYTKVPDTDLIKNDLRKEHPSLTESQLNLIIQRKYNQNDFAEDEDKEFGLLTMQMDANKIRQREIANQQSFKIPVTPTNTNQADWEAQQQAAQLQMQQEAEQYRQFLSDHPATKSLIESKRVAIELGEGNKPFYVKMEKPEQLMKVMTDDATWQKFTRNEKGEPNVAKMQRIALVATNDNYEKDIFNAGKAAGLRAVIEEGQNAKKPTGGAVVPMNQEGTVVTGTGKIGNHR